MKSAGNIPEYLKGAVHLHTDLSHDGTMTIEQLASFLKSKGYDFIAITEHSYDVDYGAMMELSNKAESLSSDDFLIIPGLEYRCHDDIDIMGFGVIEPCEYETPGEVITHIQDRGGVAVWAHPSFRDYPTERQWLEGLDGAEMWNQIHDSRYMPRTRSVNRFNELRKVNSNLLAYCGLDLHRPDNFFFISTTVSARINERKEILAALKAGNFASRSRYFNIDAEGGINRFYYFYIWSFNYAIKFARWLRDKFSRG
jgi:hypothetical protein